MVVALPPARRELGGRWVKRFSAGRGTQQVLNKCSSARPAWNWDSPVVPQNSVFSGNSGVLGADIGLLFPLLIKTPIILHKAHLIHCTARLWPAHLAPRRPQAPPERRLPVLADQPQMHLVIGARAERGPGGHADAVETHLAQRRFPSTEGEEERTPNNGARDPAPPKPCEVQGVGGRSPTSPVWPCSGAPTSAPPRAKP